MKVEETTITYVNVNLFKVIPKGVGSICYWKIEPELLGNGNWILLEQPLTEDSKSLKFSYSDGYNYSISDEERIESIREVLIKHYNIEVENQGVKMKATIYTFEKGQPVFFDTGNQEDILKRARYFYNTSYLVIDENQKILESMDENQNVWDRMNDKRYVRAE